MTACFAISASNQVHGGAMHHSWQAEVGFLNSVYLCRRGWRSLVPWYLRALLEKGKEMALRVETAMQRYGSALFTLPLSNPRSTLPPQEADTMSTLSTQFGIRSSSLQRYGNGYSGTAIRASRPGTPGKYRVCQALVQIGDKSAVAVLDSGASRSVLTTSAMEALGLRDRFDPTPITYYNADGHPAQSTGQLLAVPITLGTTTIHTDPAVTTADNYDCLIGNDVLGRARVVMDYSREELLVPSPDGTSPPTPVPIFFRGPGEEHVSMLTPQPSDHAPPLRPLSHPVRSVPRAGPAGPGLLPQGLPDLATHQLGRRQLQ